MKQLMLVTLSLVFLGLGCHNPLENAAPRDQTARIVDTTNEVSGLKGTIGTRFTIYATDFGDTDFGPSNYWNVYVGPWRCVVQSWTPTQIEATFIHQLVPGVYDVKVVRKYGDLVIQKNAFRIMPPALDTGATVLPIVSSAGADVRLKGMYFGDGTAQFKVYVYSKQKSWVFWLAEIKSWSMNPVTGESECTFTVPDLPPGSYIVRLRNLVCWSVDYEGTVIPEPIGTALWARTGTFGSIAVDASGNVYATGFAGLAKYNSSGTALWARTGPSFGSIAVDSGRNVYVAGSIGTGTYTFGNGVTAAGTVSSRFPVAGSPAALCAGFSG